MSRNGKGSGNRTTNHKAFRDNYVGIKWPKVASFTDITRDEINAAVKARDDQEACEIYGYAEIGLGPPMVRLPSARRR